MTTNDIILIVLFFASAITFYLWVGYTLLEVFGRERSWATKKDALFNITLMVLWPVYIAVVSCVTPVVIVLLVIFKVIEAITSYISLPDE